MTFDPNQTTPSGKSDGEIEAREAEYIRAANEALSAAREKWAGWWGYSVSHNTFEMIVGRPNEPDNVVLSLSACDYLAGPVDWPGQRIEVVRRYDAQRSRPGWEFEIRDVAVGFRAVGRMFRWQRGFDLWAQGSLWGGRGTGPLAPLTREQAEAKTAQLLHSYYNGHMPYHELGNGLSGVLSRLPVVQSFPDLTETGDSGRQLQSTLERIARLQEQAVLLRKVETNPVNYRAAVSGFLAEIDRMQAAVREYLSFLPREREGPA